MVKVTIYGQESKIKARYIWRSILWWTAHRYSDVYKNYYSVKEGFPRVYIVVNLR